MNIFTVTNFSHVINTSSPVTLMRFFYEFVQFLSHFHAMYDSRQKNSIENSIHHPFITLMTYELLLWIRKFCHIYTPWKISDSYAQSATFIILLPILKTVMNTYRKKHWKLGYCDCGGGYSTLPFNQQTKATNQNKMWGNTHIHTSRL